MKYPSCDRFLADLLKQEHCPLCRLVYRGFTYKIEVPLDYLDPLTSVSYRYVRPEDLLEKRIVSIAVTPAILLKAGTLLLEVSIKDADATTWIHALGVGEVVSSDISQVPLSLVSDVENPSSLNYSQYGIGPMFDWSLRKRRHELNDLLPLLSAMDFMKGRRVDETVDTSLMIKWIELCNTHGERCRPLPLPASIGCPVWMIDVRKRMLISEFHESEARAPCYAALSYVWGGREVRQLKYTAQDGMETRLKSPGGLGDHWNDIPHTIKDAMVLCERLSIPYLWVDALCLDQDSVVPNPGIPKMPNQFDAMSKIYQGAYITIVGAAGQDSWAGLPGIRPGSRQTSWANESVDGTLLGLYRGSSPQVMTNTKWNTRAWAYQEMVLSKRILVFTEEEILYECASEFAWRESIFAEHLGLPPADFSIPSLQSRFKLRLEPFTRDIESRDSDRSDMAHLYDRYTRILLPYLRREMTYPSDVLRAFQGVLSEIETRTGHGFFKGLLVDFFYQSLVFDVSHFHPNLRRAGFPSWSWCGWNPPNVDSNSPVVIWEPFDISWLSSKIVLYRQDPSKMADGNDRDTHLHPPVFIAIEGGGHKAPRQSLEIADYCKEWASEMEHMLVFSGEILLVRLSRDGKEVENDEDVRKYEVLSPNLDFGSIDLNQKWRDNQPDELEFVAIAETEAYDPHAGSTGLPRARWEDHLIAQVVTFLLEKDEFGISRRAGLYKIEKQYWEDATKQERLVYLC
jgi:hypothetical protein